jgi:hypothetical protein
VWTELFREDQIMPQFLPTDNADGTTPASAGFEMFDLAVKAIGNTLDVQVIDPDGNVFDYPLIIDNDNPLMTGTVGLQTWGTDNVYFTNYGGVSGPLLTLIPEPATMALLAIAFIGATGLRRRRSS